ncbi:Transcription factor [Aspergillus sclerotialis]|uniref:Transcription factor n=1 Tax=Aspergillus sclerotialis TaxID=2070753 RepID=A0A3A3A715_9EURO|nr:Transcription factor [Aspergillus sclerotialis]
MTHWQKDKYQEGYNVAHSDILKLTSHRNSYIQSLEERIAYLESKLHRNGIRDQDPISTQKPDNPLLTSCSPSPGVTQASDTWPIGMLPNGSSPSRSPGDSGGVANATIDKVLNLTQRSPGEEHSFSTILLATLINSRANTQLPRHQPFGHDVGERSASPDILDGLDTSPISLPTENAARYLVKAYFQFTNLVMPLLHEPTFEKKLQLLYRMPEAVNLAEVDTTAESRIAVFFVTEVFAVAILSLQKQDPSKIPTWLADRYHATAIRALSQGGLPNNVEGVQALLLIGQFFYHHPNRWPVWKTIGAALRLAVELGLHQDPPTGALDFLTLDIMRRTFWVGYAMDKNISVAMDMPSSISDGVISAKFPSEVDDRFITPDGIIITDPHFFGPKSVSLHFFRYRQLQSEMQRALYEKPSPPYALISLDEWQQHMRDRIDEWYTDTPCSETLSNVGKGLVQTLELTYHAALFYLFRPSLNIPSPSGPQLLAMARSAIKMIHLYRRFFDERKLTIYWQAVENLSSAGTSLMFGYVQSPLVREHVTFQSLETLVHTCSSVLWGMVERFPSLQNKRDAFDMVVSEVLADLRSTNNMTPGELSTRGNTSIDEGYGRRFGAGNASSLAQERENPSLGRSRMTQLHSAAISPAGNNGMQGHPSPDVGDIAYTSFTPFLCTDFDDGMKLYDTENVP